MTRNLPLFDEHRPMRLGFLVSGRGSNLRAVLQGIQAGRWTALQGVLVVSDRPDAAALEIGRAFGLHTAYLDPGPYRTKLAAQAEERYVEALRSAEVDAVVLAGFMRIVKGPLLDAFEGRIFNIHPSLLPKYPGLDVQRRALEAGESESGCTVHLVDRGIDSGRILGQRRVAVLPGDRPEDLAERILVQEHDLFGSVLEEVARGILRP